MKMFIILLFFISTTLGQSCLPEFNTLFDISYSAQQKQFTIVGMCDDGPGGQKVYTSTDNGNTWNSNSVWKISNVWMLTGIAYGGIRPQWVCMVLNF